MTKVYSVSQVNSYIKNMFVQDYLLNRICVSGEVSNCKYHSSGHIYFTLKDQSGTLSAVMFAGQRKGLAFVLKEGQQVIVTGSVDVYERDGKYQLYAREIRQDGDGILFERFQKLKAELEEMGMFAAEYKQPIPRYATRIGIVTAPTGAAIRDIINIARRRNPYAELILYPALVQGEQAKYSIAQGIRTLDALGLDVLIVGRGGGSIEDLWAFNEEIVARAIFDCRTPVISAVGHETDVTIADFVADLRAPTPSAGAELAVFELDSYDRMLLEAGHKLQTLMEKRLAFTRMQLQEKQLRLKVLHPEHQLREKRQQLEDLAEAMRRCMEQKTEKRRQQLALLAGQLQSSSPLVRLNAGYGYLADAAGHRVTSVTQTAAGEELKVWLADGSLKTRVTEIRPAGQLPAEKTASGQ